MEVEGVGDAAGVLGCDVGLAFEEGVAGGVDGDVGWGARSDSCDDGPADTEGDDV